MNTRAKQAGAGDAWQPIETAPKDGEDYLFADWRVSDGFMQVCYWDDTHPNFPWRMKDATGYSAAFFTHWKRLSDEICSTPQPEPKALEPVADPIGIENIVVHEVCCCGECKPNERTIGVVSRDEYKAVFDMWQFQKKSHVDNLNQARVEVAEKCLRIVAHASDSDDMYDQIKQLADQMRSTK
jgi:hypothetical protein